MPLILNVDDFEAARYAITRVLRKASFEVSEAGTGAEALERVVTERPDLVLLDVNLPDMSGYEVCRRIKSDPRTARIPVLHMSASSRGSADRVHGLNVGADSYLTEPVEPEVLVATVRAALRAKQAEDAMRAMAEQWQATFDAMAEGVALADAVGRIQRWNRSLERLTGCAPEQLAGRYCYDLWDRGEEPLEKAAFQAMAESRRRQEIDVEHRGRWFHVTLDPVISGGAGEMSGAVYVMGDITGRKRLEEQFREAQKFESIGQLAGGVAHDFNNLLTSILGNASLVLGELDAGHPEREHIEEVMRASNRAADLTRQLLAYAGKGRFVIRRLDISQVIEEMEELLRSAVPRMVDLRFELSSGLPPVEADASQIQQVVMNLVSNAAEAIGEQPGSIRVATWMKESGPVRCAVIEVEDSGSGMDEHTRAHLFDPFFSTRFAGRGLGLSAVSGIVRVHRGSIDVESAPGRGSTFRVLLPAAAAEEAAVRPSVHAPASRTVLVVDDEEMVRRIAKTTLEIRGYPVLLAANGEQAVEIVRDKGGEIAAVLLDLTMPVMPGEEALQHILALYPGMRVIATSGYDQREAARRFGNRIAGFLQKPYTSRQLAEKIRSMLEGEPDSAGTGA